MLPRDNNYITTTSPQLLSHAQFDIGSALLCLLFCRVINFVYIFLVLRVLPVHFPVYLLCSVEDVRRFLATQVRRWVDIDAMLRDGERLAGGDEAADAEDGAESDDTVELSDSDGGDFITAAAADDADDAAADDTRGGRCSGGGCSDGRAGAGGIQSPSTSDAAAAGSQPATMPCHTFPELPVSLAALPSKSTGATSMLPNSYGILMAIPMAS